jgi:threonine dehydratase
MDAVDVTPRIDRVPELDRPTQRIWLVREDTGPLGSFKWRGAESHCAALAAAGEEGVVAASTGNFAAAVAWAARRHRLAAEVVVPGTVSAAKYALLVELGASVRRLGADLGEAAEAAREIAAASRRPYFEDGGSEAQLAGVATLGEELAHHGFAAVVAPVACGALAAGIAQGLARNGAPTAVVGVQVGACSRLAARFHERPDPPSRPNETIADGLADDRLVEPAFGLCLRLLREMLVVDDADVRSAMRLAYTATGTLPEGAGAAALAGFRRFPERVPDGDVAIVVSGANVAPDVRAAVLGEAADR